MLSAIVVQGKRWDTIASLLPGAHCRWKAGFPTEVTFDGRHLVLSKLKIFHILECLSVRGVTDVHHKCLFVRPNYLLQVKPVNIGILCVPASCFEIAFTDVVVEWA
jgi:hypothetical protein